MHRCPNRPRPFNRQRPWLPKALPRRPQVYRCKFTVRCPGGPSGIVLPDLIALLSEQPRTADVVCEKAGDLKKALEFFKNSAAI